MDQDNIAGVIDRFKYISSLSDSEANFFSKIKALKELEENILAINERSIEERIILAEISMELKEWGKAVKRWRHVSKLTSRYEDKLAIALARKKNFVEASQIINRIRDKYNREANVVDNITDKWVSSYLVQKSHRIRMSGNKERARELIKSGLLLQGKSVEEMESLLPAIDIACDFRLTNKQVYTEYCKKELELSKTPLIVSGFYFSGSGAVIDYLRGFESVSIGLSTNELACFVGPYGATKIINSDRNKVRISVSNFVLWSLLGVMPPLKKPQRAPKTPLVNVFNNSEVLNELANIGISLLSDLKNVEQMPDEDIKSALRKVLLEIITLDENEGKYLLLNNCIRPYNFQLLEFFSDFRAVAVIRDPRDQYVSQLRESRNPIGVEEFIDLVKSRYYKFLEYYYSDTYKERTMLIRFEEFVIDQCVRNKLARTLGLSPNDISSSSGFDPIASQKNIGIYKSHGKISDVEKIGKELADLI